MTKILIDEKDREILYKHYKEIADELRAKLHEANVKADQYAPSTNGKSVSSNNGEDIKWRELIRRHIESGGIGNSIVIHDANADLIKEAGITREQAISRIGSSLYMMTKKGELSRIDRKGIPYFGKPEWLEGKEKEIFIDKVKALELSRA